MDPAHRARSTTTDGQPPERGYEAAGAPQPIDPATGQHRAYWVLSADERAKGFVRPVRNSYRHVGIRPRHLLRTLTPEEQQQYAPFRYVRFESYPDADQTGVNGRYWTQAQLDGGCGTCTTMSRAIAETYARDPSYYGSTFCVHCRRHFAVEEFVWEGTDERLGSDVPAAPAPATAQATGTPRESIADVLWNRLEALRDDQADLARLERQLDDPAPLARMVDWCRTLAAPAQSRGASDWAWAAGFDPFHLLAEWLAGSVERQCIGIRQVPEATGGTEGWCCVLQRRDRFVSTPSPFPRTADAAVDQAVAAAWAAGL
jgi:hypothetical protein